MQRPASWGWIYWIVALLWLPACLSLAPRTPDAPATPASTPSAHLRAVTPLPPPLTAATPFPLTPSGSAGVDAFIDPGHGGVDDGATGVTSDGRPVAEKTITLAIALQTAAMLEADGFRVALSRTDDSLPDLQPGDLTAEGDALTPDGVLHDLQRRIDRANASGARVLLSIHLNSFDDPEVGGAETIYDASRPFADQNLQFAQLVQQHVVAALHQAGYPVEDRGVVNDSDLVGGESLGVLPASYHHLVLLGPELPGLVNPSQMPGALSEPLFISNPKEATLATNPAIQQALARAYADAIEAFLRGAATS